MTSAPPDFAKLKSGMKAAWTAGDFGQIATFTAQVAADFVHNIGIPPGARVLDVACGTGNTAIPAARRGAAVTGCDIAPNLLAQARLRATGENLDIRFEEGDAEDLPFPDSSFDVVISMFGAMFAPRPERVASELLRVCKPGGFVAMANWTPTGFVGKSFQITSRQLPPPPGLPAPALWGDEATVRQRFAAGVASLDLVPQSFFFHYPFGPKQVVEFFRQYFGPTNVAFSRLDPDGQATMAAQLEALWSEHNTASDGTTRVQGDYLQVKAIRA
ncbi:MAG TPA: class I SAM-dependent methyltransferase [Candidatus Binatia bacterium]|nr:class I SAM-dependent methyltransferase [Candidatus Binatia bacterium]